MDKVTTKRAKQQQTTKIHVPLGPADQQCVQSSACGVNAMGHASISDLYLVAGELFMCMVLDS